LKTHNNLYANIYDFENLHRAYLLARKNKRYKQEILEFGNNLEENLIHLQNELIYESYLPSPYRQFTVYEPKERLILALPFRDRVLQHAICSIIEPIFDRTMVKDSYACRKTKGVLKGVKRVSSFVRSLSQKGNVYCLKMDIRKYFYSIEHETLFRLLKKKIRCKRTLKLLRIILDSSQNPGIPIGNLTSQLFANVYLNEIDHFIKEELRIKHYVRYMDDMIILDNNKKRLGTVLAEIKCFLGDKLFLSLNRKTQIFPIEKGIDFLGYRQFEDCSLLRKRVMLKNFKKFKKLNKTNMSLIKLKIRIDSFLNLCSYCKSGKIVLNIKQIIGVPKWELMYSK
jgi:RNA-directed DNA polymerase